MQPFTDHVTPVDQCLILEVEPSRFLITQYPGRLRGSHFWVPFSALSFPFRANVENAVGHTLDLLLRTDSLPSVTYAA